MLRHHPRFNSLPVHTAILLAISLPYFINLGKSSIWDANEAFYAETPREMLVTGDYLSPQFNFEPRTQKPPLAYWTILISYKLFGVNEFAVRFPGALAAIGVVLFSYATARLLFSPRAALIAAVVAATTPRIFILARRLPIDILLLFFLTGTLFFLVHAVQKRQTRSWALAYFFASLGFLTKGPIAAIIPAAACLGWMLWSRRLRIAEIHLLMGIAIFAVVALPWYALIYRAHGWTYISPFFLRDNLGRFAAESLGPSRGVFFYFSVYATDFFPWSLLCLVAVYWLWVHRRKESPVRNLSFGVPLIWSVFTFFLFSFSKNKQEYYIAPLYPAAAVILAGVLDRCMQGRDPSRLSGWNPGSESAASKIAQESIPAPSMSGWAWPYALLALLLFFLSLVMPYMLGSFMPDIPLVLNFAPSLVLVGGSAFLIISIVRRRTVQSFPAMAIPLWTIFMMGSLFYVPALESFRPVKSFSMQIARSPGDYEAGYFRVALPSMVFYLRRPIFQESSHELMMRRFQSDRQVFCILTRTDYTYFAGRHVTLYVLDRRSHFAVRLGALLNADYFPGEELLLVSNRPYPETTSGRGRSTL